MFIYPGDQLLFADNSLDSYDAAAAVLFTERVVAFLHDIDGRPPGGPTPETNP